MLYGHSQDLARAMPLIRRMRPAYWKCIDPDVNSAAECQAMGVKLIVRHAGPWDGGEPENHITPLGFVRRCKAQPWWPYAWAVETPNEPHPGDLDWLTSAVIAFTDAGKECVVGNWGTGWSGFHVPGAKWYGVHEYGWPLVETQAPWHARRYESWFPAVQAHTPDARLLITECGVTQAVEGRADVGWQTGPSAAEYWGSLQDYAARWPFYVEAAFVFQVGGFADWATFEVLGTSIEEWMAGQESAPSAPGGHSEEGAMPDNMTLGDGMRRKADYLTEMVTGKQMTGERYLGDSADTKISYAIFERGKMEYYAGTGVTAWFPFA